MEKSVKIPDVLLDEEGYPTEEFLEFIRNFSHDTMPILDFLDILKEGWYYGDLAFKLHKKYGGKRKLELHTFGWSGNEDTIAAVVGNFWCKNYKMKYTMWETGGHYYFDIF